MRKYILIKRDPEDNRVYQVYISNDQELAEHIRGTFDHTEHVILSITNTAP